MFTKIHGHRIESPPQQIQLRTLSEVPIILVSREHVEWLSPLRHMLQTLARSKPIWTQSIEHIFTGSDDANFTWPHENSICTSINASYIKLEGLWHIMKLLINLNITWVYVICIYIKILSNWHFRLFEWNWYKDRKKVLCKQGDWRCLE